MRKQYLIAAMCCAAISQAQAVVIAFDLKGTAGTGLLPGNEPVPPAQTNASGGEIGAGIFYDDVVNLLTLNIGWGSSQGFRNLSSSATNSHVHGPTASNFGSGFTQTAGVLFSLTRSSNASTGGFFTSPSNTITLTDAQETDLLNGKYYVNIHTTFNSGGEIRGFLVPVPEVSTLVMLSAGLLAVGLWARRKA